jgi:hypothetical protein
LPKGRIARVTIPEKITIAGAIANRNGTAACGRNISLPASLTMSASGWTRPTGPTRLGP